MLWVTLQSVTLPLSIWIFTVIEMLIILFIVVFYSREQLSSLLKTYNSYYSDQENLQLSHTQVRISVKIIQKAQCDSRKSTNGC